MKNFLEIIGVNAVFAAVAFMFIAFVQWDITELWFAHWSMEGRALFYCFFMLLNAVMLGAVSGIFDDDDDEEKETK